MNKKLLIVVVTAIVLAGLGYYLFLHKPIEPIVQTSTPEESESVQVDERNPSPYLLDGRVVSINSNGITFTLPSNWTIGWKSKPSEDWKWDEIELSLSTGARIATIVCPAMGEGPYESATTTPILTRSFSKSGNIYEADFQEYGYNRVEAIKTEHGTESRYIGPPKKTDVVKSLVHPVVTPAYETGCLLTSQGAATPLTQETIDALKSIYLSWH